MKLLLKKILIGKKEPGITYIELLIAIALAGVIGLLLVIGITTSSRLFSDQRTTTHISVQNRIALDEITNQVRSSAWVADCPDGVCGDPGIEVKSSNSHLVLALWPLDGNDNPYQPETECAFDYIVYSLNTEDHKLIKQTFPDTLNSSRVSSSDILATDVIKLTFDYDSGIASPTLADEVTIDLSNQASSINRKYNINQKTTASLRNKYVAPTSPTAQQILFPYVLQTESSQMRFPCNDINIYGNVSSGDVIKEEVNTDCLIIHGDAWAASWIKAIVTGDEYWDTIPAAPLPKFDATDILFWKNEAEKVEIIELEPPNTVFQSGTGTLGPAKINGDLHLNGCPTIITGTIYVTGNITVNGCDIVLDDSFGPFGTVIYAEGSVEIKAHSAVRKTSQNGYILFVANTSIGIMQDVSIIREANFIAPFGIIGISAGSLPIMYGAFAAKWQIVGESNFSIYYPENFSFIFEPIPPPASNVCTPPSI